MAAQPQLEAFREAAQQGDCMLHLSQDGAQWEVKAVGSTPSQRSVAWVEPQTDTTSAFLNALGQSFSQGITRAVARELDLSAAPGRPLSSRTVRQAVDMAQTSQTALSGVDFLTRLQVSTIGNTAAFAEACRHMGIDPAGIGAEQRTAIDARMLQRFEAAMAQGRSPVDEATARAWLAEELRAGA